MHRVSTVKHGYNKRLGLSGSGAGVRDDLIFRHRRK